jgi:hypothetical protein
MHFADIGRRFASFASFFSHDQLAGTVTRIRTDVGNAINAKKPAA